MSNPFEPDESESAHVYEAEFRTGTGRDVDFWIEAEQGYLELYIGGDLILDIPDTIQGGRMMIADFESLRDHLLKAQTALQARLEKKIKEEREMST